MDSKELALKLAKYSSANKYSSIMCDTTATWSLDTLLHNVNIVRLIGDSESIESVFQSNEFVQKNIISHVTNLCGDSNEIHDFSDEIIFDVDSTTFTSDMAKIREYHEDHSGLSACILICNTINLGNSSIEFDQFSSSLQALVRMTKDLKLRFSWERCWCSMPTFQKPTRKDYEVIRQIMEYCNSNSVPVQFGTHSFLSYCPREHYNHFYLTSNEEKYDCMLDIHSCNSMDSDVVLLNKMHSTSKDLSDCINRNACVYDALCTGGCSGNAGRDYNCYCKEAKR